MSDEGAAAGKTFAEAMVQMKVRKSAGDTIKLPKCVERESALLFVDMSGFTKLSTMLDVESLSKVINSYFDMIVGEVIQYGGDILKFAGDAFFAEWKVVEDDDNEEGNRNNPLAHLNASLASINEFNWNDDDDIPKLSSCVLSAARCGASIVKKFSDYQVTAVAEMTMLNVHCGVGVGRLVGLHVGDFKEDQEEEGVELRREFLILGEPIDQVSFDSA
jgi:class 3 adenylate cyclase